MENRDGYRTPLNCHLHFRCYVKNTLTYILRCVCEWVWDCTVQYVCTHASSWALYWLIKASSAEMGAAIIISMPAAVQYTEWTPALLMGSLEIQFSCQSIPLHSVQHHPSQSSVSCTPFSCLPHQPALISLLQMTPPIWLMRLMCHRIILLVANITFIIISTTDTH